MKNMYGRVSYICKPWQIQFKKTVYNIRGLSLATESTTKIDIYEFLPSFSCSQNLYSIVRWDFLVYRYELNSVLVADDERSRIPKARAPEPPVLPRDALFNY